MATNNDNVRKNAYYIYRLTLGDMILSKSNSTLDDLVLEQRSNVTFVDNDTNLKYNVTLNGVKVNKKIYQPTEIEAELDFTPKDDGVVAPPSMEAVSALLLQRHVTLELLHMNFETINGELQNTETGDTYTIAENCYVYELDPQLRRFNNSKKLFVKLNIFSMDKLMTLNKYSKAYVARKLGSGILKPESVKFGKQNNSETPLVKTNIKDLKFLKYNETVSYTGKDDKQYNATIPSEFIQPYLVQYNESFYDFLVRTANRCGEFLYFEDGALTLGLPDSGDAIQIDEFEAVTKQKISTDPLVIEARVRDSIKDKAGEVDDLNHTAIDKDSTGFPTDAFAEHTVSNAELATDEYFFPLFKDKFTNFAREIYANGTLAENLMSRAFPLIKTVVGGSTAGWAGVGASAATEIFVTEGLLHFTAGMQVDTVNLENKSKFMEPYKGKVEQYDDDKVVQFSSLKEEGWTTIKYYNDIHKHESEQQRQIVSIDMGAEYVDVKLGQKIKVDKLPDTYIVIQVQLLSNNAWTRNYLAYDSDVIDVRSGSPSQVIYAIPSYKDANDEQKEMFIPPVHPVPVIRKAGPQTAFVTDNFDPKYQGRVRVAYPWQTLGEDLKTELAEAEQRLEMVEEEKRSLEMQKSGLLLRTITLEAELKEVKAFVKASAEERKKMLEDLDTERQKVKKEIQDLETTRASKDQALAAKEAEIEAMKNNPTVSKRDLEVKQVELEIYRRDLMAQEIKDIEAKIVAKKKELEKIDEREANMKAAAEEHDEKKPDTTITRLQETYNEALADEKNYDEKMAALKEKVEERKKEKEKAKEYLEKTYKDMSTPWIRVASPMATDGGGAFFRPRVGDEVLINFDSDNVERPYVVGSLYSKNTLTPDESLYRKAAPVMQWKNLSMQLMSPNGHHITFTDPPGGNSFITNAITPGMGYYATLIPGVSTLNSMGEGHKDLGGGIHIGDRYGMYEIEMKSHKRSIDINSPFGTVSINAFSGITISAPNGNVTIKGKNISLEAGNKISMVSGKNIEDPDIGDPEGKGNKTGKKIVGIINSVLGAVREEYFESIVDLSLIRHVVEVFARPVDGTMLLKSKRFLKLEAGPGNAAIPCSRYSDGSEIEHREAFYKHMLYYIDHLCTQVDQFFEEYETMWRDGYTKAKAYKLTEGYGYLRKGKEPDIVSAVKDKNVWSEDLITLDRTFKDNNGKDRFHPNKFNDKDSVQQVKEETLRAAREYAQAVLKIKKKVESLPKIFDGAKQCIFDTASLKGFLQGTLNTMYPNAVNEWKTNTLVKDKLFQSNKPIDADFFSKKNKVVVKRKLILTFIYKVGNARFNLLGQYIMVKLDIEAIKKTHVLNQEYYWKRQVDIIDHRFQSSKLGRAIWENVLVSVYDKFKNNFRSFGLDAWHDRGQGEILFSDHEDSTLRFDGTGLHEEKDANIGTIEHLKKVLMGIE